MSNPRKRTAAKPKGMKPGRQHVSWNDVARLASLFGRQARYVNSMHDLLRHVESEVKRERAMAAGAKLAQDEVTRVWGVLQRAGEPAPKLDALAAYVGDLVERARGSGTPLHPLAQNIVKKRGIQLPTSSNMLSIVTHLSNRVAIAEMRHERDAEQNRVLRERCENLAVRAEAAARYADRCSALVITVVAETEATIAGAEALSAGAAAIVAEAKAVSAGAAAIVAEAKGDVPQRKTQASQ